MRLWARAWPSQTARRQPVIEAKAFPAAWPNSPLSARESVCRLNEEKVVKPPQTPVASYASHEVRP